MDTDDLLKFDPLAHAEKLTGKSYKGDEETLNVGLGAHLINSQLKEMALSKEGDTHWSVPWTDFHRVLEAGGFQICVQGEFIKPSTDDMWPSSTEFYEIWFNEAEGLLVTADSWTTTKQWDAPADKRTYYHKINSAMCYGNIQFAEASIGWSVPMSSSPLEGVQYGRSFSLDCREGFRHKLRKLREQGTFLTPWVEPYYMHLTHYGDKYDERWSHLIDNGNFRDWGTYADAVTAERIEMLPDNVKACIGSLT